MVQNPYAAPVKLTWPAPERNKQPILEVLQRTLGASGELLEVASGTGQHAEHFARHLPTWSITPSDLEPDNLASITARVAESALPNLREPLRIDAAGLDWHAGSFDVVYNANLIHIAPWEAAVGLVSGAARHLRESGLLIIYGPFRIEGRHTAPSNESFDADLKQRDARWGVRDLEALIALAEERGFSFQQRIAMPANNQTVVFKKG